MVQEVPGILLRVLYVNNTRSKIPDTSHEEYFLLVLLGLGVSQEVRVWACDFSSGFNAIIVLTNYNKFSSGLAFKVHEKEVSISYPVIANPFDTEEC